ncbi:MAG TPA: hypothetical protein HPQ00_12770, partial [Magnetococcales bacterium]|nr:hypothetical protein [Magnetococcales bacterium]
ATTELRKLPATILSRCQRYELKRVPEILLTDHMARILEQEAIPFEKNALELVAQAAEGSVRDALSLLDQVISHGAGTVAFTTVGQLLGLTDGETTLTLMEHLLTGAGKNLLDQLARVQQNGAQPESIVRDMLAKLHAEVRARVTQTEMRRAENNEPLDHRTTLFRSIALEHLQMVYMVLNKGGNELRLTDQPWRAMEMLLLRACYLAPVPDLRKLIQVLGKEPDQGGGHAPPVQNHGSSSQTPVPTPHLASASPTPPGNLLPSPPQGGSFPRDWDRMIGGIRLKQAALATKLHAQLACLGYQVPMDQQPGRIELQLINDCFGPPDDIRNAITGFIEKTWTVKVEVIVRSASSIDRPETLQEKDVRERGESMGQLEKEVRRHPGLQPLYTRFNAEILSIAPI